MTKHFQTQTELLKKMILRLAAMVEEHLRDAVQSVIKGDLELAKSVVTADDKIDQYEVEVEEDDGEIEL